MCGGLEVIPNNEIQVVSKNELIFKIQMYWIFKMKQA